MGMAAALYTVITLIFLCSFSTENDVYFSEPARDTIAARGQPFWWNCTSNISSQPDLHITYRWRFNDGYIAGASDEPVVFGNGTLPNGTLLIYLVDYSHAGQYQCVITVERREYFSPTVNLNLAYLANSFSLSPGNHNSSLNGTITLSCEILSIPPARITWLFNGNDILKWITTQVSAHRSVLQLRDLSYNERGEYRCQAVNEVSNQARFSAVGVVHIRGPPQLVNVSSPVTVLQGSTIYLHCRALADPPPIITWSTSEDIMPETLYQYTNGTLRVDHIQLKDGGLYSCSAANKFGSVHHTVLVTCIDSLVLPAFSSVPDDVTKIRNSTYTLLCLATGSPDPVISWINPAGREVSTIHTLYNGALTLSPNLSLAGLWKCQAKNEAGTISTEFLVTLLDQAAINFVSKDQTVTESETLSLTCSCRGDPLPIITWRTPYSRDTSVSTSYKQDAQMLANSTLTIQSLDCNTDHGLFTCVCSNEAGSASRDVYVNIQCRPVITQFPTNVEVNEGEAGSVHCSAFGRPAPQIFWYRDNSLTPLSTGVVYSLLPNGTLVFNNMKQNMQGTYTCSVTNLLGVSNQTFTVTMLYIPRVTVESQYVSVKLNISVILNCQADGLPLPALSWRQSVNSVVEDANIQILANSSLHIQRVRPIHYGEYECVATNSVGTSSTFIHLISDELWIHRPINTTAVIGSTVIFSCKVTDQSAKYNWYFLSQSDPIRRQIISSYSGNLSITNVHKENEGIYICEVSQDNSSSSAWASLSVMSPPVGAHTGSVHNVTVAELQNVTLLAKFHSVNHSYNITWYNPARDVVGDNSSFNVLHSTVANDWGLWEAKACNIYGCTSQYLFLHVQGIPDISEYSIHHTKDNVSIVCLVKGSPIPDLYYYQSQTLISSSVSIPGHHIVYDTRAMISTNKRLVINRSNLRSPYSCITQNTYGLQSLTFKEPVGVKAYIEQVSPTSITVAWIADTMSEELSVLYYTLVHATGGVTNHIQLLPGVRNHTISDVLPYSSHSMTMTAVNEFSSSEETTLDVITSAAVPSSPTDLSVREEAGVLRINWAMPEHVNGHPADVEFAVAVSVSQRTSTSTVNATSTVFYPPSIGIMEVVVKAFNLMAIGSNKNSEPVTQIFNITEVQIIPVAPSGVKVLLTENRNILISWNELFGIWKYSLHYDIENGFQNEVVIHDALFYELDDVTAGATYRLKISGVNDAGTGVYSSEVEIVATDKDALVQSKYMQWDLVRILALTLGILLLITLGVIFTLFIIYRRNRKRQAHRDYHTNGNFKTRRVLEEYIPSRSKSPNGSKSYERESSRWSSESAIEDKEDVQLSAAVGGSSDGMVQRSDSYYCTEGEESSTIVEVDGSRINDVKIILTGEERGVDVIEGEVNEGHELSDSENTEAADHDLASIVAKMRAESSKYIQTSNLASAKKETRKFKKLSEFDPRIPSNSKDESATPSMNDSSIGTMSRRRPLAQTDLI